MNKVLILISIFIVTSCASTKQNNIQIVEEKPDCDFVANMFGIGFSIIPPLASTLANEGLRIKAEEFGIDTVYVYEKEGIFKVKKRAYGYSCN